MAVYALSFWHYYLYWLAYYQGAVPLDAFKRDAILMKAAAIMALGFAYLSVAPDLVSLTVVGSGFLLNTLAARALGADRTYYGYEVAGLSRVQIKTFPYSWVSHPMLIGNIAAFGGTMINADFRSQWWPLACAHVAFNIGLLVMETALTPQRRGVSQAGPRPADATSVRWLWQSAASIVVLAAALGAVLGSQGSSSTTILVGAFVGAGMSAYAVALECFYSTPCLHIAHHPEIKTDNAL
jgi:hypothetical protein